MFDDPAIALINAQQGDQRRKIAVLKNGKQTPLSKREANDCRESISAMLRELWRAIDYGVTLTTADPTAPACTIWQDTSKDDHEKVVQGLLELGQKYAVVGMLLRSTVRVERVYGAGSVIAMNTIQTAMHYSAYGLIIPGSGA